MSDSIGLDQLGDYGNIADDGVRRDRWGRYLVVPPEGGRPVAYRRTTTVAKALDAEGSLVPWAQSRAMLGLVRDSGVLRRLRALLKVSEDPWYSSPDDKAAMKVLVAEAATAGGAETKRDRGTWLHGCAERWVLGLDQLPAFNAADAQWLIQLQDTLRDAGVVIDPDGVEQVVVHDGLRIAGKADYLQCRMPGFAKPLLGDLKTGDSLEYALRGYVVQLAVYVHADACYRQGADPNGSEDVRSPMPDIEKGHALLIHAPQNGGPVTLYLLDMTAGLEAFKLALAVEQWRNRKDVAQVYDGDLTGPLAESIAMVERKAHRDWLQGRIDIAGRHSELSRRALESLWAQRNLRGLRLYHDHTDAELAAIEDLLREVEARFCIPFGDPRPHSTVALVARHFPGAERHPSNQQATKEQ